MVHVSGGDDLDGPCREVHVLDGPLSVGQDLDGPCREREGLDGPCRLVTYVVTSPRRDVRNVTTVRVTYEVRN